MRLRPIDWASLILGTMLGYLTSNIPPLQRLWSRMSAEGKVALCQTLLWSIVTWPTVAYINVVYGIGFGTLNGFLIGLAVAGLAAPAVNVAVDTRLRRIFGAPSPF